MKGLIALAILLTVLIGLVFINSNQKAEAGSPWSPELISPPNGSTASSNPPTLCARYQDPDGQNGFLRFEAWGGGEGNHYSDWIPVNNGGQICWTDVAAWSVGGHNWQARAKDSDGNQSGASPDWGIMIPSPPSPPTAQCDISTFNLSPSAPQTIGVQVDIYFVANCTNGVGRFEIYIDSSLYYTSNGTSSGHVNWNTNGYQATDHVVNGVVYDAATSAQKSRGYTYLLLAPGQNPDPTQTPPSGGGGGSGGGQSPPSGNNCPSAPTQLSPGIIALNTSAPLNVRELPGLYQTIKFTINNLYTYVSVISGPQCADGYRWFEIGIDGQSGWAAEVGPNGNYLLVSNGTVINPPTQIPPPSGGGSGSNYNPLFLMPMPTSNESLMCIESVSSNNWFFNIIPVAHAARFDPGQCTDWIDQQYPELIAACLPSSNADAHRWDELFIQNCNFSVSSTPQVGDIAVFEIDSSRPYGHVAYVLSVESTHVQLSEYNVGDLTRYTNLGIRPENPVVRPQAYPTLGLSFIHVSEGLNSLFTSQMVVPLKGDEGASYFAIQPTDPLFEADDIGNFIYYTYLNQWHGISFQKVYDLNGLLLFYVDPIWELFNPGWEHYHILYVYHRRP